ncbi:Protein of unknown function [Myxococcus fulvus]|uniref:DUF1015 domain-containing protein n=1 Tax=Myxococcus fulvus TaxID=33 RepID=A0A511T8Q0_MYXFU|nr:DUF1015 family protein [Myxococcus fulvus]AKF81433.1 hypothetical protein MFUL124B02_20515 [Myxococcus fulvus 124B02]GEN09872.1 hypothetical protein MFU01_49090 [Myxococcus fulvus]SEU26202.1 Protein of unknown function [Myxococcus fulvus]
MARVHPFTALLTPLARTLEPSGYVPRSNAVPQPSHVRPLLEAANPTAELRRQRESGTLLRDARPALYVVEVHSPAGKLGGPPVRYLLCALRPDAGTPLEDDPYRPRAWEAEPAVTLTADDHGVFRGLLAEASERSTLVWEGDYDGHRLSLRRIEPSPVSKRIQAVLDEAPMRPLSALAEGGPTLAAVVPLSDPGLEVLPIHRALKGVETFKEETFLTLVTAYARVYELDEPLDTPRGLIAARERLATLITGHHAVLLVLPGGRGRILRFRQGLDLAHLKGAPRNPTLRSLDLALLNALVLRTVLGIREPEAAGHPQVFPVQGLETLVKGVESGTFQVGFALNPPPIWEVRAVMEAQATLPPRTLRVEPLPPAGLLFLDTEA